MGLMAWLGGKAPSTVRVGMDIAQGVDAALQSDWEKAAKHANDATFDAIETAIGKGAGTVEKVVDIGIEKYARHEGVDTKKNPPPKVREATLTGLKDAGSATGQFLWDATHPNALKPGHYSHPPASKGWREQPPPLDVAPQPVPNQAKTETLAPQEVPRLQPGQLRNHATMKAEFVKIDGILRPADSPFDFPGTKGGKILAWSIDEKKGEVAWEVDDGRGHHRTISFHDPMRDKNGQIALDAKGQPKRHPLEPMLTAMIDHHDVELVRVKYDGKGHVAYAMANPDQSFVLDTGVQNLGQRQPSRGVGLGIAG